MKTFKIMFHGDVSKVLAEAYKEYVKKLPDPTDTRWTHKVSINILRYENHQLMGRHFCMFAIVEVSQRTNDQEYDND